MPSRKNKRCSTQARRQRQARMFLSQALCRKSRHRHSLRRHPPKPPVGIKPKFCRKYHRRIYQASYAGKCKLLPSILWHTWSLQNLHEKSLVYQVRLGLLVFDEENLVLSLRVISLSVISPLSRYHARSFDFHVLRRWCLKSFKFHNTIK